MTQNFLMLLRFVLEQKQLNMHESSMNVFILKASVMVEGPNAVQREGWLELAPSADPSGQGKVGAESGRLLATEDGPAAIRCRASGTRHILPTTLMRPPGIECVLVPLRTKQILCH